MTDEDLLPIISEAESLGAESIKGIHRPLCTLRNSNPVLARNTEPSWRASTVVCRAVKNPTKSALVSVQPHVRTDGFILTHVD